MPSSSEIPQNKMCNNFGIQSFAEFQTSNLDYPLHFYLKYFKLDC